jgi:hypothetical protein
VVTGIPKRRKELAGSFFSLSQINFSELAMGV